MESFDATIFAKIAFDHDTYRDAELTKHDLAAMTTNEKSHLTPNVTRHTSKCHFSNLLDELLRNSPEKGKKHII